MATAGVVNGTLLSIYRNTTGTTYAKANHTTQVTFNLSHSPRSTTSQDSGGWDTSLEGLRGATFSISAFYASDATEGFADWVTAITGSGRGAASIQFTTNVSGDDILSADVYIESVENTNNGPEESASFSVSGKVTGAVTVSTV